MDSDLRTAPRYFLVTPLPAMVNGRNADVIDLSVKGARLQLTESLAAGAMLPFSLEAGGASVVTSGLVLWCELAAISLTDDESDRYYCGMAFDRPLSVVGHLIDDLLADGSAIPMEESRNGDRFRVNAPLTAIFDGLTSARVLDISLRGARIGTPRLLEVGVTSSIRFKISGREMPVDVSATVVWARPSERVGRYEAGLRIDGGEDWLRVVIDELSLRNEVIVEPKTLERKFNPLVAHPTTGLLGFVR